MEKKKDLIQGVEKEGEILGFYSLDHLKVVDLVGFEFVEIVGFDCFEFDLFDFDCFVVVVVVDYFDYFEIVVKRD